MMTSLATIGLTLVTHPLQMLMAVVALYNAGAALFGSRRFNGERPPKAAAKTTLSVDSTGEVPMTGSGYVLRTALLGL